MGLMEELRNGLRYQNDTNHQGKEYLAKSSFASRFMHQILIYNFRNEENIASSLSYAFLAATNKYYKERA